jgi:hypothetical protein
MSLLQTDVWRMRGMTDETHVQKTQTRQRS